VTQTHEKLKSYTVVPSAALSDFPLVAFFGADYANGDEDIGGRISNVDELRFYTADGTLITNWISENLTLSGSPQRLHGTALVVHPSLLSSALTTDTQLRVRYGGTPPGSGGPSSALSLSGLVGWWLLESTSCADRSGNGNDGTAEGSLSTGAGKIGTACVFDGDAAALDLGSISSSDPLALAGQSMWISVWLKPTLTGDGFQRIFDKSSGGLGANGYWAHIDNTNPTYGLAFGAALAYCARTATKPASGAWSHISFEASHGANGRIYVNGTEVPAYTEQNPLAIPSVTADAHIGTWNHSTGREYSGDMDDLRVYSRMPATGERAYIVAQGNSPGTWGAEQVYGTTISCTTAAVSVSGLAATISAGTTISCTTAAVSVSGLAATISTGTTISCTTAAVSVSGLTAAISVGTADGISYCSLTFAGETDCTFALDDETDCSLAFAGETTLQLAFAGDD